MKLRISYEHSLSSPLLLALLAVLIGLLIAVLIGSAPANAPAKNPGKPLSRTKPIKRDHTRHVRSERIEAMKARFAANDQARLDRFEAFREEAMQEAKEFEAQMDVMLGVKWIEADAQVIE